MNNEYITQVSACGDGMCQVDFVEQTDPRNMGGIRVINVDPVSMNYACMTAPQNSYPMNVQVQSVSDPLAIEKEKTSLELQKQHEKARIEVEKTRENRETGKLWKCIIVMCVMHGQ